MRAHFLWRTGALPFFPGREEKEDFSRGRWWERAEALLGSSARSDLDGFSVIKTRCANVSGPLHVETARSRGTGGVAPERLPPVREPAVLEFRLEGRFCGRQCVGFSPDLPSSLFYGLLLIQTWKRPGSAQRPRHCLRSVLALAEFQQGLNPSVPSLSVVPCDELLSILYTGYLRNVSFKKNKFCC